MKKSGHADRTHAKDFSPSKADTWFDCTAQPILARRNPTPDRSSDAADEGTAAHELLEACLITGLAPTKFRGKPVHDRTVDEEMVYYVGRVVAWVRGKIADGYELQAERALQIACTGDKGTTDITLWHPQDRHLIVADLKYGKGYAVSAQENRQMRLYACGTADEDKLWKTMRRLTLVVWQPRLSEEPSEWEDSPKALAEFRDAVAERVKIIRAAVAANAKKPKAPLESFGLEFKPGEKACKWCTQKATCAAFAKHASAEAGIDFAEITSETPRTPSAELLTTEDLVAVYRNGRIFGDYLKAVAERLFAMALDGEKLPGLKLVEGKSNRQWTNEGDVMESLHRLGYKADDFAPRALAGLGVIERLFKDTKRRAAFMAQHTIKPKGKPSLADENDDRPTYIRDEFAGVEI